MGNFFDPNYVNFDREFAKDCREKKNIAASARHQVKGSKSKFCGLPSDHMTLAQWKKRNGEVMSYKLGEPCTLKEFKSWPHDIQEEYINNLRETYHITNNMLGQMWGTTGSWASVTLSELGLNIGKKVGRISKADRATREAMWEAFCNGVVGGGKAIPEEDPDQIDKAAIEEAQETNDGSQVPLEEFGTLFETTLPPDRVSDDQVEKSFGAPAFRSRGLKLSDTTSGHCDYNALRNWANELVNKAESADLFFGKDIKVSFTIETVEEDM